MQLFKYIVILSSFNFLFRYCLENDKFSILVYNHYKETRHQWNGLTKMKPKFSDSDSNDKLWLVRLIFVIDIFFSWIKLHLWWSLHITSVPGLLEGELLVAGIAVIICSSSFGPREGVWQISELLGWSSWHVGCVFRVHSDAQIIVGEADVYAGIQSVDGTGREGSTNGHTLMGDIIFYIASSDPAKMTCNACLLGRTWRPAADGHGLSSTFRPEGVSRGVYGRHFQKFSCLWCRGQVC